MLSERVANPPGSGDHPYGISVQKRFIPGTYKLHRPAKLTLKRKSLKCSPDGLQWM